MWIEAFSAGKNPAAPEANEDRFVVLPGRAYAVIDGVTDRAGVSYDGRSSGRIAAELIQSALERLLCDAAADPAPLELIQTLSDEIAAAYRRHGLSDRAALEPNLRFGATLALFRHRPDCDELVLVGDSGIRLDGASLYQVEKPLDAITASLRIAAWRVLEQRTGDIATLTRLGRQIVFHGATQGIDHLEGLLDAADLAGIADAAATHSASLFPDLPLDAITGLIAGGIVNGQFPHQNSATSLLGYSCIDGFEVPPELVTMQRFPRGSVSTVELFSDGYFSQPDGFGVATWEDAADAVERIDPFKVGRYPSVKGSHGALRTDDRTYVGIRR